MEGKGTEEGRRAWKASEVASALRLFSEGVPSRRMADAIGRPVDEVEELCAMAVYQGRARPRRRPEAEPRNHGETLDRAVRALHAAGATAHQCAECLGVGDAWARERMKAIGLRPRTSRRPWTDADIETLEAMAEAGSTAEQCAEALGRDVVAVRAYAFQRGVALPKPLRRGGWTKEELAALERASAQGLGAAWVARCTGRTVRAVKSKAEREGLSLAART